MAKRYYPADFKTELNGKIMNVSDEKGQLLHVVDVKWLAKQMLNGEKITKQHRSMAGACILHLLSMDKGLAILEGQLNDYLKAAAKVQAKDDPSDEAYSRDYQSIKRMLRSGTKEVQIAYIRWGHESENDAKSPYITGIDATHVWGEFRGVDAGGVGWGASFRVKHDGLKFRARCSFADLPGGGEFFFRNIIHTTTYKVGLAATDVRKKLAMTN